MSKASADARPQLAGMKFLVEALLDAEGSGKVVRIGDRTQPGRRYALKFINREGPDDDVDLARAKAACEASAKLGHPVPLRYHDFRVKRKWVWFGPGRGELLMEFVPGKAIDAVPDLSLDQLVLIFQKVASGLAHMHRRSVRHGDLAPRRILLTRTGDVKLLGYGLAQVPPALREQYKGERRYMAPEQIRGKILGDRTDVYSLGAVMYHQMTGQPANVGGRSKGDVEKIPLPARLNPAIGASLNNLLVGCLQSDPPKRPETMYEVSQRLDAIVTEMGLDDSLLRGVASTAD
ncbi:serine/threonine-protein kinase [Tautonia plasticadhaerens]|uniref:Serine/threonine-protein kinase PrkC n=1 Tax=Tautonia plasticadhaerens TaxID=2527974 RepID=A0A518GW92_9BACT|nr:serine/threonine-protein kinase [Tautonia plasticadhaerens]QDV32848.1 Serine/threonine-protein kinase PrkC [Tautonia plasticadhaerens]